MPRTARETKPRHKAIYCYPNSLEDRAEIEVAAKRVGKTLSDFGIDRMLAKPQIDQTRLILANEIRSVGVQLRDAIKEYGYASEEVLSTLLAVQSSLNRLDHDS